MTQADIDAIYAKFESEGVLQKLLEINQVLGLDAANALSISPTLQSVGSVAIERAGVVNVIRTLTRQ